jgi:hypothetical protein
LDEVDKIAIECVRIQTSGSNTNEQVLKNKDSLLQISIVRNQPILRCGKKYAVVDGSATAYIYEDK